MGNRTAEATLANAKAILATAERGLEDLSSDEISARLPGLHNVVVFGRAVTNVLQGLRSSVGEEFDRWYGPKQEEMRNDKLLQHFYKMRSEVLKEGVVRTRVGVQIDYLNTSELQPLMANPPEGATAFFIGDQLGGSGWTVELPDGTFTKFYVKLPEELRLQISFHLDKPIRRHLGRRPDDQSAAGLSRLYIDYLRNLVSEAEARFGPPKSRQHGG